MSNTMDLNRQKLEELKRKREERRAGLSRTDGDTTLSVIRSEITRDRQYSVTCSEEIHIAGSLVETYEREVQCVLETRSLDSKTPQEREEEEIEIDLLLPRQQKRKKEEGKKEEAHVKEVQELQGEELQSVVKSKHFTDFFNRSSKFVEKMLDHGEGDMIELLLREGVKSKDKSGKDILAHSLIFVDPIYTSNRVVTDLDWSSQISDLFLASYSKKEEGSIKDQVGVVLLWNPALKNRPEFYCFCQSAVTSAKFFPFSNSTIFGGCSNGQIVIWDIRIKSMPVQRSGISLQAHKYPVNSLNVVGTQIANNLASFSNDGMMCVWDVKQFSKPVKFNRLTAIQATRAVKQSKVSAIGVAGLSSIKTVKAETASSMIMEKVVKEEPYDINVICGKFPMGDANNYYVGSLNGALYKNALHNRSTDKITMYDEHDGPISSLSINNPSEHESLNGLVLTSSFDWTVKLWSPQAKQSLKTFENFEDFVYDVAWNPVNPSLFATVNNEGYLDIFDLTRDLELPIAHEKVSNYAQNKTMWNQNGSAIVSGDSSGALNMYILAEKYRKMDPTKSEDMEKALLQPRDDS